MVAKNEGSFIEQVDAADLSSLNPLATGVEVTDLGTNRCSLFDEQNNKDANSNKRKNRDELTPEDALARSQRVVKMNNPYDEVSITRR